MYILKRECLLDVSNSSDQIQFTCIWVKTLSSALPFLLTLEDNNIWKNTRIGREKLWCGDIVEKNQKNEVKEFKMRVTG